MNGSGIVATLVYIPNAPLTLDFALNERNSALLSGSTGLNLDAFGDLARLSIVGAASTGIVFAPAGDLSKFTGVNIGTAPGTMAMALDGLLTNNTQIPAANGDVTMTPTANLLRIGGLQGDASITLDPQATLSLYVYLDGDTGITIEPSGDPRNLVRLSGVTGVEMEVDGTVVSQRFLAGQVDMFILTDGSLSVNALGKDIDTNVMVRPFTERTMVRK